jgi:hypothetical protein
MPRSPSSRFRHCAWRQLDVQVASAIAKQIGRRWRLDKANTAARIDAVVALALACERAQVRPEPARLLGWV